MKKLVCYLVPILLISQRGLCQSTQPSVEDRVRAAVKEMDDDDFHVRETGVKHMLDLPPEALVYLDRIASDNTESPEVIARIQFNIERLRAKARGHSKLLRATQIAEWEAIEATKGYKTEKWQNPKWDSSVKDGFSRITSIYDGGNPNVWRLYPPAVFTPFQQAIDAGCNDPLVTAYYLRTGFNTGMLESDAAQKFLSHVFPRIMSSAYSPALKMQAAIDFASAARHVDPGGSLWTPDERYAALKAGAALWPQIVNDPSVPDVLLEEIAARFLDEASNSEHGRIQTMEPLFNDWLAARPKSAGPWAFKSSAYLTSAEELIIPNVARDDDEIKIINARVATARDAAEKAYAADIADNWAATQMILICKEDPKDPAEMEQWFQRATQADPDNLDACLNKLAYLAANGTSDDVLKFGRQCVDGARWQGQIPLAIIRAHRLIAGKFDDPKEFAAYFQSSDVWNDYQNVFSKFLEVHKGDPMDKYYRSLYAQCACDAEKWSIANQQFKIIGDHPEIGVFKSMSAYNYLRKKAERLATVK